MHASSGAGPQGPSSSAPLDGTSSAVDSDAVTPQGGGDDGADSNQGGAGMTVEEIERALMEDSDGAEGDDGIQGREGRAGAGGQQQADELSAFEMERLENIRRNQQRLRELGLLEDPLIPQRQPPAPRQPRQPRASDGPRRQSSRLQGASAPLYDDEASSNTRFDDIETIHKRRCRLCMVAIALGSSHSTFRARGGSQIVRERFYLIS